MPKLANPESKTIRLVLVPKEEQEEAIRAFKQIAARNGLKISDLLYEKVAQFLKEHNWPPGNSQTILPSYGASPQLQCFRCEGKFSSLIKVRFISGLVKNVCSECLKVYQEQTTVKKVLGVTE